jgi:hypothetical protein
VQEQRRWCRVAVGMLLLMSGSHAWACTSIEGLPVFAPDVKAETDRWIRSDFQSWEATHGPLRAIDARVVSIRRAKPDDICGLLSSIKVEVEWAEPTGMRLEDVGIYFKVISGTGGLGALEYSAFNDLPRVVTVEDGIVYVHLQLPDTASPTRGAVDLDVEVFAVDKLLRIGPSSRLRIRSDD